MWSTCILEKEINGLDWLPPEAAYLTLQKNNFPPLNLNDFLPIHLFCRFFISIIFQNFWNGEVTLTNFLANKLFLDHVSDQDFIFSLIPAKSSPLLAPLL